MSKISQRQDLNQKLSPQQILQAKLFQLNSFALEQRLYQEIERNPLLELPDAAVDANDEQEPETSDLDDFEILDHKTFTPPKNTTKKFIIITAAYVEGIRLIDNIQFEVGATK